jgi:hypothetical protein
VVVIHGHCSPDCQACTIDLMLLVGHIASWIGVSLNVHLWEMNYEDETSNQN